MNESKPGYKTTEFWLSLLAMLVGAAIASGAIGEATAVGKALGFAALVLSQLGYTVSRTALKKAPKSGDGPVTEELK